MRLYRLLLHLYPASFRNEYGAELSALFERKLREAGNPVGRLAIWIGAFFDVLANAAAVHWDILRQDLRHMWRAHITAPGFAITAIAVIALGVGANTAAFSVADFVLIRPLPFATPDRLVTLWQSNPGYSTMELSAPNYRDWRQMSTAYDAFGAYHFVSSNLVGQGDPQRLAGTQVAGDAMKMLGIQPMLGRTFTDAEMQDGAKDVLLSYGLWRDQFGSNPGVVGQAITLDGSSFVVIGVMPRSFAFPDRTTMYWAPMPRNQVDDDDRSNNWFTVIARMRPGVTHPQASADIARVAALLAAQYPKELEGVSATLIPLRETYSSQSRMLLLALCGAAICVLLIACANLASLLLVRAQARQRELAVRSALGAGRERLVRQLMSESLVLAIIGGALGVGLAAVSVPLLTRLVPESLPTAAVPGLDLRVLAVAAALTIITGIVFGVVPALKVSGKADLNALREGARAGGGRRERARSILVIVEVMSSVVLLVSAGLLMRAMWRIQAVDPGFKAENVMTLRTSLPFDRYPIVARRAKFYQQVLAGVEALPGVKSAGYASYLPMAMGGGIWSVTIAGEAEQKRTADHSASLRYVTPGYFNTMGIPIRVGRGLAETDVQTSQYVVVVSESFAKRHWPGENAIGKQFKFAFGDRTIVGISGDVRVRGPERTAEPQVYVPYQQVPDSFVIGYMPKDLAIRSSVGAAALLPAIRRIVHDADPEVPISNVKTMSEIVAGQTASRSVQVRILGAFALIAILLAGVGIHGLLAYSVSQRSREFGVRIALGAKPSSILGLVMRQSVLLALAGIIPGVVVAYGAGRALASLLAGIQPGDIVTFATAVVLCVAMTLIGSLPPVLRAVRVDPNVVMRGE